MRFKEHYLTEKAVHPEFYETAVVRAWNGQTVRKDIKPFIDEVVKQLKSKGLTGKAKQVGRDQYPLTKEWLKYGAVRKKDTPKTDLIIGKHNISMKLKPSAMLMSGAKSEAQATFMNVIERIEGTPDLNNELVDVVKDEFENFKRGITTKGKVADVIEKGSDKDVVKLDELHKNITKNLMLILNKDPRIGSGFVKEAMSGYNKFGKNSEGSADYVLAFTKKGTNVSLGDINDNAYIKKILGGTRFSVNFKTNKQTKGYAYWSTMKLNWTQFKESIHDEYSGQMLTEGVIGDVIGKVKNFFVKMFKKIYTFISKSFQNFLQFFGLTPEVKFNNNVEF